VTAPQHTVEFGIEATPELIEKFISTTIEALERIK
jgi:hypothetical protein